MLYSFENTRAIIFILPRKMKKIDHQAANYNTTVYQNNNPMQVLPAMNYEQRVKSFATNALNCYSQIITYN